MSAVRPTRHAGSTVLTERTIDKHGNTLLLPEYMLEGWTTTLPARIDPAEVITLYCEHATHEQFHSEFKTDMDLEYPS